MISAVLKGKIGKKIGNLISGNDANDEHWRVVIKNTEDALTSAIFDLCIGLSGKRFASILSQAVRPSNADFEASWMHSDGYSILLWQSLYLKSGERVEPDVILIDKHSKQALVFEMKLNGQQSTEQLLSEIDAFNIWYDKYNLQLIALGGENSMAVVNEMRRDKGNVFSISYYNMLESIKNNLKDDGLLPVDRRVMNSLVSLFSWYCITGFSGIDYQHMYAVEDISEGVIKWRMK